MRVYIYRRWLWCIPCRFFVEQIEPEIVLEKRVEDIGGNDITGLGVNLARLDYVLHFKYSNDIRELSNAMYAISTDLDP